MTTIRKVTILSIVIIITFACDKSIEAVNSKYDYQTIWKCHYQTTWDINKAKTKLIGVWEWKYINCCGETTKPYQNGTESKGLRIQFKDNGTGVLIDNDAIGDFTWNISLQDNDLFGFETVPPISSLAGRLLFCDDIMMCNNSYIDGADNFFEKQK